MNCIGLTNLFSSQDSYEKMHIQSVLAV